jgi:hypothetical protein
MSQINRNKIMSKKGRKMKDTKKTKSTKGEKTIKR